MTQMHSDLANRISRLPVEKLTIAMTFINFLEHEKEADVFTEIPTQDFGTAKKRFSELNGICKVWISDDFDEPLEEMREYME
ncbi:MAG: DUF2281 domain-containing protein [Defluviitaleaceae bacterium]|nr:DUF2281 domain-containing protein [Defluviitaleaceae bacterium]